MSFKLEYSKQNADNSVIVSFSESFRKKNSLKIIMTEKSIIVYHEEKEILFDSLENFVNDLEAEKYKSFKPTKNNMKKIVKINNPRDNVSQQDIDNEKAILEVLNR